LFNGDEGSLFQNWMQRKLLSRFVLSHRPENHHGLGLDAYVTATSPIRKYFDLITQRQVRALLGLETPYSKSEINSLIQALQRPMSLVAKLQYRRLRYWLLKYMQGCTGQKEEAIVLNRRRNGYAVLLKEYLLECHLPFSNSLSLRPEDLIQVTLQHIDARRDVVTVFMG
jgi:exoribonuclease-2